VTEAWQVEEGSINISRPMSPGYRPSDCAETSKWLEAVNYTLAELQNTTPLHSENLWFTCSQNKSGSPYAANAGLPG